MAMSRNKCMSFSAGLTRCACTGWIQLLVTHNNGTAVWEPLKVLFFRPRVCFSLLYSFQTRKYTEERDVCTTHFKFTTNSPTLTKFGMNMVLLLPWKSNKYNIFWGYVWCSSWFFLLPQDKFWNTTIRRQPVHFLLSRSFTLSVQKKIENIFLSSAFWYPKELSFVWGFQVFAHLSL